MGRDLRYRYRLLKRPQQLVDTNPAICSGQPVFRGTGIPVAAVVGKLRAGTPRQELELDFPQLSRAALDYSEIKARLPKPPGRAAQMPDAAAGLRALPFAAADRRKPQSLVCAYDYGYPAEAAANVGGFMLLVASMEVHPGVIALREAELTAEQQWLRLQAALAYVEQTCGGDLLNRVLEVQADGLFVLQMIHS